MTVGGSGGDSGREWRCEEVRRMSAGGSER